ncbi:hypothetical protein DFH08DRAFT_972099 [Mycena albidolilacea]|uniref:Uncharacterized protein n=1 Tax=Mycena albidolilacea TaxID=1033008 RepID=A0AAD6ZC48_9AGAR|nr:hypothetical protein DFH08DRAFT_972099 [Mycena albidolilacea]
MPREFFSPRFVCLCGRPTIWLEVRALGRRRKGHSGRRDDARDIGDSPPLPQRTKIQVWRVRVPHYCLLKALSQQPAPSSCPRLPRTACSASRTLPPSFFKLQDLRPRRRCGERPRVILLPPPRLPSREGEDLGAGAGGRAPPVRKLSAPMAVRAGCQELAPPRTSCNAPRFGMRHAQGQAGGYTYGAMLQVAAVYMHQREWGGRYASALLIFALSSRSARRSARWRRRGAYGNTSTRTARRSSTSTGARVCRGAALQQAAIDVGVEECAYSQPSRPKAASIFPSSIRIRIRNRLGIRRTRHWTQARAGRRGDGRSVLPIRTRTRTRTRAPPAIPGDPCIQEWTPRNCEWDGGSAPPGMSVATRPIFF